MKMNRKAKRFFLGVAAILCLCTMLTACGSKPEEKTGSAAQNPQTTAAAEPSSETQKATEEASEAPSENPESEPAEDAVTIVDGKETIEVSASTVEEALKEANITLGEFDQVKPALTKAVSAGDTIKIKRAVEKEEKVTEEIPFGVQEAYSEAMVTGTSAITQAGQNGQKEVTYKVTYVGKKEVNREVVSETVTAEPIAQVVTYGTGQAQAETQPQQQGKYEINRVKVPGCADGSYGYYEIYYSDGTVEYEAYHE